MTSVIQHGKYIEMHVVSEFSLSYFVVVLARI